MEAVAFTTLKLELGLAVSEPAIRLDLGDGDA